LCIYATTTCSLYPTFASKSMSLLVSSPLGGLTLLLFFLYFVFFLSFFAWCSPLFSNDSSGIKQRDPRSL
jgi:hypothetical protein